MSGIYFLFQQRRVNLPLLDVDIHSQVLSTACHSSLTQTFRNPSSEDAIKEAVYTFPLYAGCAVTSFTCHIGDDKTIRGIVKPKETAKQIYQEATARGETAGLLEQHTPDVFSTKLGNIPASVEIRVVIETIQELKHDSTIDGIRLTVPTSIAPRYGSPPEGLWDHTTHPATEQKLKLSVDVCMEEPIKSLSSPSHPTSITLGSTTKAQASSGGAWDPSKANCTFSTPNTSLDKDIVFLISTATPAAICKPQALLENHSTIPNQKALMLSLVPRFQLPAAPQKPEIIFVADRSGSMGTCIGALISALQVFLKSLPIGCRFNILSFGSRHSLLWEKSQFYTQHTLEEAMKHISTFSANYGGTDMLSAINSAFESREKSGTTEICVLTDGEIWALDALIERVRKEWVDSEGKVRVYSIGVGMSVSHALVEGLARAGGGHSQIVNEEDGWEGKIVRMLKASLSEHISNYRLEVEEEGADDDDTSSVDTFEMIDADVAEPPKEKQAPAQPTINLFDSNVSPDQTVRKKSEAYTAPLKDIKAPTPLTQAPYSIPPLVPFERTTVYLLFPPHAQPKPIKSVKVLGTTPSGVELALAIPVTELEESGTTIHKLAARSVLRDLEEGRSWLHSGKYGISKDTAEGRFDEYVSREGTKVGVRWGLASNWTSFVAVEAKDGKELALPDPEPEEEVAAPEAMMRSLRGKCFGAAAPPLPGSQYRTAPGGPFGAATFATGPSGAPPPPPPAPTGGALFGASSNFGPQSVSSFGVSSFGASSGGTTREKQSARGGGDQRQAFSVDYIAVSASRHSHTKKKRMGASQDERESPAAAMGLFSTTGFGSVPSISSSSTPEQQQQVIGIINLQSFDGSFAADKKGELVNVLGLNEKEGSVQADPVWLTVLVLVFFEVRCDALRDVWELVAEKAKAWLGENAGGREAQVEAEVRGVVLGFKRRWIRKMD